MDNSYEKKNYLRENFRIFHLRDQLKKDFEPHYHDFHKIVMLISGRLTYNIEGHSYNMKPGEIVLVRSYRIHQPVVDSSVPYERYILWIQPDHINGENIRAAGSTDPAGDTLSACFDAADLNSSYLLHPLPDDSVFLHSAISELASETSGHSHLYADDIMSEALYLRFMVSLNRLALKKDAFSPSSQGTFDETISLIMDHINSNLAEDLSIDHIADKFYMSRYYLMHRFRAVTGCTLHSYINQKRLANAHALISGGTGMTRAAELSGFSDYSTFYRLIKAEKAQTFSGGAE